MREELIDELIITRVELLGKIKAIDFLLTKYSKCNKSKGNKSWKEYVLYILKEIKGKIKSTKVCEFAIRYNPLIDKKIIFSIVRTQLWFLSRNKNIQVEKGKSKKLGYLYYI